MITWRICRPYFKRAFSGAAWISILVTATTFIYVPWGLTITSTRNAYRWVGKVIWRYFVIVNTNVFYQLYERNILLITSIIVIHHIPCGSPFPVAFLSGPVSALFGRMAIAKISPRYFVRNKNRLTKAIFHQELFFRFIRPGKMYGQKNKIPCLNIY